LGLAILTKYSALAALPLMVAYPILRTKPRALMSLLIPVVVVLLWGLHGWVVYGRPHFFRTGVSRSWNEIGILIQCSGRALSGCAFVFPILLALQWNRARAIGLLVAGLLTMAFGWPFAGIWIQNILEFGMVINLAAFTFLLGRTIWGGTRQAFGDCTHSKEGRDKVFLVLWALSFPAFNLVAAEFVAIRYLLPSLPPLLILSFLNLEEDTVAHSRWARPAGVCASLITAVFGLWVSIADLEYAGVYRAKAQELSENLNASEGHLWFAGHWGWRHYAAASGMKQVPQADEPLPEGDVLVIPVWSPRQAPERIQRFREVSRDSVQSRWFLRTGSPRDRGAFYKVTTHLLPYAFETGEYPLETFVVYSAEASR